MVHVRIAFNNLSNHEAGRALDDALGDGAVEIQATAQQQAPVDTGRLRSSIKTDKVGGAHYEVSTDVDYAEYQEYGTRYQSGTPFMRPAYERNRQRIVEDVSRSIKEAF